MIITTILAWVGLWALLSRIFSGSSRFLRHLLIALAGTFAICRLQRVCAVLRIRVDLVGSSSYQYVAIWAVFAIMCFFHLREVGPGPSRLKAAVVTTLLAIAVAVQTLQLSEALSNSGRQYTERRLMPPAFRAVPLSDQDAFFGAIAKLKARLDDDRALAEALIRPVDAQLLSARTWQARLCGFDLNYSCRLPVVGMAGPNGPETGLISLRLAKNRYIPRHLTRKHGSKGRPLATGPNRLVCSHVSGGTNRRT